MSDRDADVISHTHFGVPPVTHSHGYDAAHVHLNEHARAFRFVIDDPDHPTDQHTDRKPDPYADAGSNEHPDAK